MKEYIIYFTDGTDTTGKAKNKAEMRKQANAYIRAWKLDCRVLRIDDLDTTKVCCNCRYYAGETDGTF